MAIYFRRQHRYDCLQDEISLRGRVVKPAGARDRPPIRTAQLQGQAGSRQPGLGQASRYSLAERAQLLLHLLYGAQIVEKGGFCADGDRFAALAGNLPIHSRSWLPGPDVARWFNIIGYVERGQENGANLFELPPARAG